MSHFNAGSQSREVMREKREVARNLLARGLQVDQIAIQLRCSRQVVRQVRDEMMPASSAAAGQSEAGKGGDILGTTA